MEAAQLDVRRDDVERGAMVPALLAPVVAEMADVHGRVGVRRAAAHAVLRVGGVLQRGPRLPWVVQPEPENDAALRRQVPDHRVVGVDDEHRRWISRATAARQRSATISSSP